jgi:predicted RNA-binding Zn-ribbon protein involved in translation (DUF1610 family)
MSFLLVTIDPKTGNIRSFHAAALHQGNVEYISEVIERQLEKVRALEHKPDVPARSTVSTLTQAEIARNSGYTGNACEQCGSFNLRRTGTCETCEDCGWNKGCG